MSATMLLVEDNPDNRKLLCWVLADAGYECVAVDTAEKGLNELTTRTFDMVLMDISLPQMDGKEATRRIRGDPRFARLPVIAVTARATTGEEEAIRACGVDAVETKPIDENHLLATISSILRQRAHHE